MGSCCSVALLGFGTVGSAVARRLTSGGRDFELTHNLDGNPDRERLSLAVPEFAWTTPIDEVLGSDVHAGPQNAAPITERIPATQASSVPAPGGATAVAILSAFAAIARDRACVVPAPVLASDFVLRPSNFGLQTSNCRFAEVV